MAPRYFETLGIPLIAGRDFSFRDMGRPRVAIVNQAMARRYFPGVNPIGKHVAIDRDPKNGGWFGGDQPYEIVGLVGDAKAFELRDAPYPTMYFNMFQESRLMDQFELRTSMAPESLAGTVRQMVRDVLKTVPVMRVTTLADQVDSNIVPERLIATLSEFFGCLGAVLAGIGLYGLLAYTVARRTNEIGIRMALGATASSVSRLVLRRRPGNGVRRTRRRNVAGVLEQTAGGARSPRSEIRECGATLDQRRRDARGRIAGFVFTGAAGGSGGPDGGAAVRIGWLRSNRLAYRPNFRFSRSVSVSCNSDLI